jgi:HSP20 family molecular chaperone IbpA
MSKDNQSMEVQEQEMIENEAGERLRSRTTFIPRSDIYETDENVVVSVDMPGVSEDTIDITLDKNILTINGISTYEEPDDFSLAFTEFQVGDYERSFRLADRIDRNGIEALFKDGVLKLTLPKAEEAKVKKISVKTK